jgi:hypothetical protein
MTTLKTFKALINGTLFKVDQQHFGGQDIRYKLHRTSYTNNGWVVVFQETTLHADDYWRLHPQQVN